MSQIKYYSPSPGVSKSQPSGRGPRAGGKRESGFTLVELLIAMTIGVIALIAISSVFNQQNKSFRLQEELVEMQQNARAAMDIMTREIRMAGYGAPKSNISSWIDWVTGVTIDSNPKIVQGSGSDPDTIYIVGCFDSSLASLSASVSSGATSLDLQSDTEASKFNTTSKKLICIDGVENAVVTAISGNTLTIDTGPATTGNQGLSGNYVAITPIYLVKVITYSIVSNTLKRNENTGGGRQPLAENIEDLQISQSGDSINVSITARTANPDADYIHPAKGDHYRRFMLDSEIMPRNPAY